MTPGSDDWKPAIFAESRASWHICIIIYLYVNKTSDQSVKRLLFWKILPTKLKGTLYTDTPNSLNPNVWNFVKGLAQNVNAVRCHKKAIYFWRSVNSCGSPAVSPCSRRIPLYPSLRTSQGNRLKKTKIHLDQGYVSWAHCSQGIGTLDLTRFKTRDVSISPAPKHVLKHFEYYLIA